MEENQDGVWNDDNGAYYEYVEEIENFDMDTTFKVVTNRRSIESYINSGEDVFFAYDPFEKNLDEIELITYLIEYYEKEEEYEKCSELLSLKVKVKFGLINLKERITLKESDFLEYSEEIDYLIQNLLRDSFRQN